MRKISLLLIVVSIISIGLICGCSKTSYIVSVQNELGVEIINETINDGEFTLPEFTGNKEGYQFIGWLCDGCLYDENSKVKVVSNMTFIPHFEKQALLVPTLTNISSISKNYDGICVENPQFVCDSDGEITVSYYKNGEKLNENPIDAGDYCYKIEISETLRYEKVEYTDSFTINKSDLDYEIIGYTGVFDKSKHGVTVTVNTNADYSISYSLDGINYDDNEIKFDKIGNYSIYVKIDAGNNYNIVNQSVSVVINANDYGLDKEWKYIGGES